MVPSLNVKRDNEWHRIMDVTYDEMGKLISFYILRETEHKHPDEKYLERVSDESMDNGLRDIYVDEYIGTQLKLNLMLIVYRLRTQTQEGDELLW